MKTAGRCVRHSASPPASHRPTRRHLTPEFGFFAMHLIICPNSWNAPIAGHDAAPTERGSRKEPSRRRRVLAIASLPPKQNKIQLRAHPDCSQDTSIQKRHFITGEKTQQTWFRFAKERTRFEANRICSTKHTRGLPKRKAEGRREQGTHRARAGPGGNNATTGDTEPGKLTASRAPQRKRQRSVVTRSARG